jgi:hypothetical protein
MKRQISVRLDEDAFDALARLESAGLTRSEAIRKALVEAVSHLEHRHHSGDVPADRDGERDEAIGAARILEGMRASR